jgi:hypothetical protein
MSDLKTALAKGRVKIKFRKVDGSMREMTGTTNHLLFNWTSTSTKIKTKPKSNDLITVWDLDKNQWRSFRADNVIEWHLDS